MQTIDYVHAQVMPGTFALSFFFDGIANLINCEGIRRVFGRLQKYLAEMKY